MGFRRGLSAILSCIGLVACGVAGTSAWIGGMWGMLTGSTLVAVWLGALHWGSAVRPHGAPQPAAAARVDADAMVLRVLLDAAPTPLLGIDGTAARALNRAARRLYAVEDRILPMPAALADPAVTHLRHEGRNWRIDRVAVANGGSVAALIDIEQEERVAEARAIADLIEIMGHELLNGLAPIASLAESGMAAIGRREVDIDLLREILGTLARRAEGLQRFTEAYRTLARLPAPTRSPVALRGMGEDLARLFAGRWPFISLSVEVDDETWPLDRDQMTQAVWALLQNAAEAASTVPSPRVMFRIQAMTSPLTIEVEDNGPGIAPDAMTRIFRPFHTTKPDGSGIGLSLARQIALAHGGDLTLRTTAGTIFRMTCPE